MYVYMNVYYIYIICFFSPCFFSEFQDFVTEGWGSGLFKELFSFNLCHILAREGDLMQPSFPQATRDSPVKNEERFQVSPVQWP